MGANSRLLEALAALKAYAGAAQTGDKNSYKKVKVLRQRKLGV